jgi:hypothetical protein
MNRLGDQPFGGAGLALQQNRDVGRAESLDDLPDPLHRGTLPDDVGANRLLCRGRTGDGAADVRQHRVGLERLLQVVERAELDQLHRRLSRDPSASARRSGRRDEIADCAALDRRRIQMSKCSRSVQTTTGPRSRL